MDTSVKARGASKPSAAAILKKISDWSMYPVNRYAPGPSADTGTLEPVWSPVRNPTASRRVPAPLAVYSLLCLANLTAGLTHYGTTTGPILFGTGYVTRAEWWRVGFYVSVANIVIWLTAGFAWWKFLGYW